MACGYECWQSARDRRRGGRIGDFTAVDRVGFHIERGEIFGFLGSNGSGKTTTMKILTGLLPPSAGEALLFGDPLQAGDMSSRYRVGYTSQSFSLYSELKVRRTSNFTPISTPIFTHMNMGLLRKQER